MSRPNPFYIDAEANHPASVLRTLAWAATEGKEGILAPGALFASALTTPGPAVLINPGPFSVLCKHQGGQFESYVCCLKTAEQVQLNPTSSSGPRTDLIIARVQNPFVDETTSWLPPADEINGPYWHPFPVEGVPANLSDVAQWNPGWAAIPICKVTRPANTNVVLPSHITDLRSLAKLGGDRIVSPTVPTVPTPPPLAQPIWTESTPVGNNAQILSATTAWTDFPAGVTWKVPVPEWAAGVDIHGLINPALALGDFIGDLRLNFEGDQINSIPNNFNENLDGRIRLRPTLMIGGTEDIPAALRGKEVTVKIQARSTASNLGGRLRAEPGTRINLLLHFKKKPTFDVY